MNNNYLLDVDFLRQLDQNKNKEVYGKIILLTQDELPVYEIQGKITNGSINVDGASAVRRTCSLTMVADHVDINNTYWALKNKFKLEVGVRNTINSNYPEIIWFKQGIYVFTSLNMSVQLANFTINLSGKDKMCLLNGENGGLINSSTDFGKLEEYENIYTLAEVTKESYIKNTYYYIDDNKYILDSSDTFVQGREYYTMEIIKNEIELSITDIIKNAIHIYGGEPLHNIVLNDIENYGLELLEYRGDKDLYMPRKIKTNEVSNLIINEEQLCYLADGTEYSFNDEENIIYYDRTGKNIESATKVWLVKTNIDNEDEAYNIIKIKFGETVGYRKTDLTYPGELIANIGESLVSVLDKIKNMFSDFEYFYDLEGRFIFQKKKTYLNNSWNPVYTDQSQMYVENSNYSPSYSYTFENNILLTAFSNNPNIANIKNDFSIWGKRKGDSIHMRYAIDKKPVYYRPIRFKYEEKNIDNTSYIPNKYYILDKENNYTLSIGKFQENVKYYEITNVQDLETKPFVSIDYYTKVIITEQEFNSGEYYIKNNDENYTITTEFVEGTNYYIKLPKYDWRELIYQMALDYLKYNHIKDNFSQLIATANPEHYPKGKTGYENYYIDIQGFWRQLYNPEAIEIDETKKEVWVELDITKGLSTGLFSSKTGFNKDVTNSPETLNFWFDFLDTNGQLNKYSIQAIGHRPKTINDDRIKAIYFQETPTVLFLTDQDYEDLTNNMNDLNNMSGYTFIKLPSYLENYFTISAQSKSANDELYSLLNQHISMSENITLTSIPIYHLQPNNRILVQDINTKTNGDYIISKITIPLGSNGTSSITATKVIDKIY